LKVHYIACAQSSALDSTTNRLSLFHLMDEIAAAAFPTTLPSLCIAALFERDATETNQQSCVLTVSLDDVTVASFALSVQFGSTKRTRVVNTVQGLTIPGPGTVTVAIVCRSVVLASWQAQAVCTQPPKAGEPVPVAAKLPPKEPARKSPTLN
jgi:hypothetical protein